MPRKFILTALAATSAAVTVLTISTVALAQDAAGSASVSPATPPALLAPMPSGNNTSGINQPGAPNTSTAGIIGTGATASGLPGESTHHPGFPGRVGGHR